MTLPGHASSIPKARAFIEAAVAGWGYPASWTAALCVSELATNCALHARTHFTVSVSRHGASSARIAVSDGSQRVPVTRNYGTRATTGRGLQMIDQLGGERHPTSKTVWVLPELFPAARVGASDDDAELTAEALMAAFADDADSPERPFSSFSHDRRVAA